MATLPGSNALVACGDRSLGTVLVADSGSLEADHLCRSEAFVEAVKAAKACRAALRS